MKSISKRTVFSLVLACILLFGVATFVIRYFLYADRWVSFTGSPHVYTNGKLNTGEILDRSGTVLYSSEKSKNYSDSATTRRATLHLMGDRAGNIPARILRAYASKLFGYDKLNGTAAMESSGGELRLSVSAQVQAIAMQAMNGRKGAVGVYNYRTGEILCALSSPTFDPLDPPDLEHDNGDGRYDGVYVYRFFHATYTPGSIFKLVTAAAAIEYIPDIFERSWYCGGHEDIGGNDVSCVDGEAHGYLDFQGALTQSCNIVFAELAVEIGAERMTATADKMGINMSFEVDDVETAKGNYDVSKASTNELAWSGVGQYINKTNPMQMAIICGAIANGGNSTTPTYIKNGTEDLLKMIGVNSKKSQELVNPQTAATLASIMPEYSFGSLNVRAKTGTAEVGEDKRPNAWMVGFSTDADAPLAFACVVENAGFGNRYARPVAEIAMQKCAQALRGG